MTVVINVYSKSNNVLGTTKAAEAPARPLALLLFAASEQTAPRRERV